MAKMPSKRLLHEAVAHVGSDVVILAPGVNGQGYIGTTLSTASSQNIERMITITNEALKKMRRWHRNRLRQEKAAMPMANAPGKRPLTKKQQPSAITLIDKGANKLADVIPNASRKKKAAFRPKNPGPSSAARG